MTCPFIRFSQKLLEGEEERFKVPLRLSQPRFRVQRSTVPVRERSCDDLLTLVATEDSMPGQCATPMEIL